MYARPDHIVRNPLRRNAQLSAQQLTDLNTLITYLPSLATPSYPVPVMDSAGNIVAKANGDIVMMMTTSP